MLPFFHPTIFLHFSKPETLTPNAFFCILVQAIIFTDQKPHFFHTTKGFGFRVLGVRVGGLGLKVLGFRV